MDDDSDATVVLEKEELGVMRPVRRYLGRNHLHVDAHERAREAPAQHLVLTGIFHSVRHDDGIAEEQIGEARDEIDRVDEVVGNEGQPHVAGDRFHHVKSDSEPLVVKLWGDASCAQELEGKQRPPGARDLPGLFFGRSVTRLVVARQVHDVVGLTAHRCPRSKRTIERYQATRRDEREIFHSKF